MIYTVWLDGEQIGETEFEYDHDGVSVAGTFHPTERGLQVLPSITEMGPALFAFGDMCERSGLDTEDESPEVAAKALEMFADTPECERVLAAASQIARLSVADPAGKTVEWESLTITDLEWLMAYARTQERAKNSVAKVDALPPHDPIKFMISMTRKRGRTAGRLGLTGTWRRHMGVRS